MYASDIAGYDGRRSDLYNEPLDKGHDNHGIERYPITQSHKHVPSADGGGV